jgi:hypothetical protein
MRTVVKVQDTEVLRGVFELPYNVGRGSGNSSGESFPKLFSMSPVTGTDRGGRQTRFPSLVFDMPLPRSSGEPEPADRAITVIVGWPWNMAAALGQPKMIVCSNHGG